MLSARQVTILKAIVEEFIESAEPVGSKTLMQKYHLPYSSATIRNDMAALEEMGYLEKTHTSSGRVPSADGYRYYVDHLLETRVEDSIKHEMQLVFHDRRRSLNEIVHRSCEMLSELTQLTSIVLGPDSPYESLQQITMVPLTSQSVTVIIVTDKGHVENKTFTINRDLSLEDIQSCVGVMNDMLIGTPIDEVAIKLEDEIRPILAQRVKEHEILFNAFFDAFMKFANNNVYFSGKENMLYQPEFNDVNKLRRLVTAFENSQMWRALSPITEDEGVTVKIGSDVPISNLNDVSVISASFKTSGTTKGTISVIGPTRMPYEKVVSLVEYVSKNIEEIFEEQENRNKR